MNAPIDLIKEIIQLFGPRKAGSEAERNAQLFIKKRLETYCSSVEVQEFEDALTAKFSSLKLFCTFYYASLLLVWISLPAALVLAIFNSVVFFFHFVAYSNWLDFLYPQKKSLNIIGTIEPKQEVRSTLIFSGHMDSTPEFIWWYWLKDWGIRLNVLSSLAFITLPFVCVALLFFGWSGFGQVTYWTYVGLIPTTLSFFFIHGKTVVDGAQDNLSGVAVADAVAKALAGRMRYTRIKVVSFGSEETGLRGSSAYVKKYLEELNKEKAHVINLDGILDKNEFHLIEREISLFVKHDQNLISSIEKALIECGISPKRGTIPVGATDGASFSLRKIPAMSIVALPMDKLHPTYHTRLDKVEFLSEDLLNQTVEGLSKFALEWDDKAE